MFKDKFFEKICVKAEGDFLKQKILGFCLLVEQVFFCLIGKENCEENKIVYQSKIDVLYFVYLRQRMS